jgi:HNH endonuclease
MTAREHPEPPVPSWDRIMSRVAPPDENGCRKWTGTTTAWGYGLLRIGGRRGVTRRVHRLVYEITFGQIPAHLFVLHACNVPPCVNALHLYLGTAQENSDYMVRCGRSPRGERNGKAVLTAAQVANIRREYVPGKTGMRRLGLRYGVSAMTVQHIISGQSWAQ